MNFVQNEWPSEAVKTLIKNTVLGSNGARYRHINAAQQLKNLDSPIYFSLMAKESCLGNITLCQRRESLYLRYFTFHHRFQASLNSNKREKSQLSPLKEYVRNFLNSLTQEKNQAIYAYIEPDNLRSLHMAKEFGFSPKTYIAMFHFSRRFPKNSRQFKLLTFDEAIPFIRSQYGEQTYYFENPNSGIYAGWFVHDQLSLVARFHVGCWEIQSFKGKFGNALIKALPWLPYVNKLINPEYHKFSAFDSFLSLTQSIETREVNAFLSAGLAHFKVRHMMHWVDESSPQSHYVKFVRWGLLQRILGKKQIYLVVKGPATAGHYFIDAMDML